MESRSGWSVYRSATRALGSTYIQRHASEGIREKKEEEEEIIIAVIIGMILFCWVRLIQEPTIQTHKQIGRRSLRQNIIPNPKTLRPFFPS